MQERKELSTEVIEDETEDEEREIDEDQSEEEDTEVRTINRNRKEKDKEQERENEDELRNQENEQIGECAICHIIIDNANLGGSIADSEQNPHSTEGYLLCQCCVRKFSIRSGQ